MSGDLVTRLRASARQRNEDCALQIKEADEIELLRRERDAARRDWDCYATKEKT